MHELMFKKFTVLFRLTAWCVIVSFGCSFMAPLPHVHAQIPIPVEGLPTPGTMIRATPAFEPALIKGVTVFPDNPLRFDFIVDTGDVALEGDDLKSESNKLIKYFLASLTVPEEDLWVNLSPYEAERIIPNKFGQTEMGRDLLAQDYILKQLTASLMYPEDELGEEFWDRVHEKAYEEYGVTDIPVNTFNKVWIVPEKAVVYENAETNTAFVVESYLKVMLEEDYFASQKAGFTLEQEKTKYTIASEVIRDIIIPEIAKEVNEGENFAQLRQIYHSLILATWFKRNLKESVLGRIYVGQNKVNGVDIEDKKAKEKIYDQYIDAFKQGAYDYIKEDYDTNTQEIVARKYFSGGTDLDMSLLSEDGNAEQVQDVFSEKGRKITFGTILDPQLKAQQDVAMVTSKNLVSQNENVNIGLDQADVRRLMSKFQGKFSNVEGLDFETFDNMLRNKIVSEKLFNQLMEHDKIIKNYGNQFIEVIKNNSHVPNFMEEDQGIVKNLNDLMSGKFGNNPVIHNYLTFLAYGDAFKAKTDQKVLEQITKSLLRKNVISLQHKFSILQKEMGIHLTEKVLLSKKRIIFEELHRISEENKTLVPDIEFQFYITSIDDFKFNLKHAKIDWNTYLQDLKKAYKADGFDFTLDQMAAITDYSIQRQNNRALAVNLLYLSYKEPELFKIFDDNEVINHLFNNYGPEAMLFHHAADVHNVLRASVVSNNISLITNILKNKESIKFMSRVFTLMTLEGNFWGEEGDLIGGYTRIDIYSQYRTSKMKSYLNAFSEFSKKYIQEKILSIENYGNQIAATVVLHFYNKTKNLEFLKLLEDEGWEELWELFLNKDTKRLAFKILKLISEDSGSVNMGGFDLHRKNKGNSNFYLKKLSAINANDLLLDLQAMSILGFENKLRISEYLIEQGVHKKDLTRFFNLLRYIPDRDLSKIEGKENFVKQLLEILIDHIVESLGVDRKKIEITDLYAASDFLIFLEENKRNIKEILMLTEDKNVAADKIFDIFSIAHNKGFKLEFILETIKSLSAQFIKTNTDLSAIYLLIQEGFYPTTSLLEPLRLSLVSNNQFQTDGIIQKYKMIFHELNLNDMFDLNNQIYVDIFYPVLIQKGENIGHKLSYEKYKENIMKLPKDEISALPPTIQGKQFLFSTKIVEGDITDVNQEIVQQIIKQIQFQGKFVLGDFLYQLRQELNPKSIRHQKAFQFILNDLFIFANLRKDKVLTSPIEEIKQAISVGQFNGMGDVSVEKVVKSVLPIAEKEIIRVLALLISKSKFPTTIQKNMLGKLFAVYVMKDLSLNDDLNSENIRLTLETLHEVYTDRVDDFIDSLPVEPKIQKLVGELLHSEISGELSQIKSENAKIQYTTTDDEEVIEYVVTRGMTEAFTGFFAEDCTDCKPQQIAFKDFIPVQIRYQNKIRGYVYGVNSMSMNAVFEEDKKVMLQDDPVLTIDSIQPDRELSVIISPEALISSSLEVTNEIAQLLNQEGIVLPNGDESFYGFNRNRIQENLKRNEKYMQAIAIVKVRPFTSQTSFGKHFITSPSDKNDRDFKFIPIWDSEIDLNLNKDVSGTIDNAMVGKAMRTKFTIQDVIKKLKNYIEDKEYSDFIEVEHAVEVIEKRYIEMVEKREISPNIEKSLHLSSGNSILPIVDALLGFEVIVTDQDLSKMEYVSFISKKITNDIELAGGSLEFRSIDLTKENILMENFKDGINHITLTNLFNDMMASFKFNFASQEKIVENIFSIMKEGGTFTSDMYVFPTSFADFENTHHDYNLKMEGIGIGTNGVSFILTHLKSKNNKSDEIIKNRAMMGKDVYDDFDGFAKNAKIGPLPDGVGSFKSADEVIQKELPAAMYAFNKIYEIRKWMDKNDADNRPLIIWQNLSLGEYYPYFTEKMKKDMDIVELPEQALENMNSVEGLIKNKYVLVKAKMGSTHPEFDDLRTQMKNLGEKLNAPILMIDHGHGLITSAQNSIEFDEKGDGRKVLTVDVGEEMRLENQKDVLNQGTFFILLNPNQRPNAIGSTSSFNDPETRPDLREQIKVGNKSLTKLLALREFFAKSIEKAYFDRQKEDVNAEIEARIEKWKNWQPTHDFPAPLDVTHDPNDDIAAVLAGSKSVAYVDIRHKDNIQNTLIHKAQSKNFMIKRLNTSYIVGTKESVENIYTLLLKKKNGDILSDYTFHRTLGQLLGYPQSSIDKRIWELKEQMKIVQPHLTDNGFIFKGHLDVDILKRSFQVWLNEDGIVIIDSELENLQRAYKWKIRKEKDYVPTDEVIDLSKKKSEIIIKKESIKEQFEIEENKSDILKLIREEIIKKHHDFAMINEVNTKGGIDLNATMLPLDVHGGKIDFNVPISAELCIDEDKDGSCERMDIQALETMRITGFTPVIFQIVPVSNINWLLGIADDEEPFDKSQEKDATKDLSFIDQYRDKYFLHRIKQATIQVI